MAVPKIFVSSTCYDLNVIRTELRSFIESYGFEPVMSEYSDVLFDYREHTHSSCLQEIPYCDMIILIIGSRFGGKAVPNAVDLVDIENLKNKGMSREVLKDKENLSITQLEYLKSIETGIPVFPFVSTGVMNDHFTWERNKENGIVDKIIFPNVDSQHTAKYIFEFINYIRLQHEGNSIVAFSNLDDIKTHLRKQWAALFQRLLKEQRDKVHGEKQINYLSEQIADLRTAIVTSISNTELANTAREAIRYRQLINFLSLIHRGKDNLIEVLNIDLDWDDLLYSFNVIGIVKMFDPQDRRYLRLAIVLGNGTYFETTYDFQIFEEFKRKWSGFQILKDNQRLAIINAILDDVDDIISPFFVEHVKEDFFEKYLPDSKEENKKNVKVLWRYKKSVTNSSVGSSELKQTEFS